MASANKLSQNSGMFVWNKITVTHSCPLDDAVRKAFRLFPNVPDIKEKQKECLNLLLKVTRPSYFVRIPSYFNLKLPGIPTFTFMVGLTYSMDNIQINLQYSIKFLAIGVNVTWLYCHTSLGSESKFFCCLHFFVKTSRLHIVRISALRWTVFHQHRKDPMREI